MKVLAIETSGTLLSAAVVDSGRLKGRYESAAERGHSSEWAPAVERALSEAGLKAHQLDLIAVGTGPGSFTGLRVGLAAAKTLAWSLGKKLVGVPSMEAIARQALAADGAVAVVLDARRGDVYGALYERKGGGWKARIKPSIMKPQLLARAIDRPALTVGAGAQLYRQVLIEASGGRLRVAEDAASYQAGAEQVAYAAIERARKGRYDDPRSLAPLYLHPKDCNVTYAKKG